MQPFRTFFSVFVVAARRLWSTRWLALAGAVGLMVVVALTLSIPLYADSVYNRIFKNELRQTAEGAKHPPYAFMYRYIGGWYGALDFSDVAKADELMTSQIPGILNLPRDVYVRYFKTDTFQIFPASDVEYVGKRKPLTWTSLGFLTDFKDHIVLTEGRMPVDIVQPDAPIEVLVSKPIAEQLGLQIGEQFVAFDRRDAKVQVPVVVVGVWEATDSTDPYWFYDPAYLKDVMIVSEATFLQNISPRIEKEVYLAVWYMVFNGDQIRTDDVNGLLGRINFSITRATSLLPNAKLDESPVDALWRYEQASRLLLIQLLAFSVPILLLVFAFITLVAGLTVNGQRNEIAVLRSRGASALQVISISFIEAIVLAIVALATGIPLAQGIAQLVGQARSFLVFVSGQLLSVVLTPSSIQVGLIAAAAAVVATILPVWEASTHTIITYKQERARTLRPPFWQRAWLDVMTFIPAAYGTYLLQKQGTIAVTGVVQISGGDPFSNPLLFLVPVLMMISLTLFLIRIFPFFLRFLAWLFSHLPGTTFVLAARQLSRSPGLYVAPMLLLILTLALATFTASLASTLDQSLIDQVRYSVGGDMRVVEMGEDTQSSSAFAPTGAGQPEDSSAQEVPKGPRWLFIPISDHLKVDGIAAATRVGLYPATGNFSSGSLKSELLGVDRLDYSRISFWRNDFGAGSLGALMNALASTPNGVLVHRSVLTSNALSVGDEIRLTVSGPAGTVEMRMTIAGWFTYWPGWYPNKPDSKMLFVSELDNIFQDMGGEVPYDVWLKIKPGYSPDQILDGVRKLGVPILSYEDVNTMIEKEQTRPERQGLFGILSVGFAASALLTVLGFFLYAVFSFRRRVIELGVLRAMGLGAIQMAAYLGWELVLLLGTGVGAGTLLGVAASRTYIPYMQVGITPESTLLPFSIIIAWPEIFRIYALFGGLFIVALVVLLAFLMRMKIFQAVKLGETE